MATNVKRWEVVEGVVWFVRRDHVRFPGDYNSWADAKSVADALNSRDDLRSLLRECAETDDPWPEDLCKRVQAAL